MPSLALLRSSLLAVTLLGAVAGLLAQTGPPDESLTESPGVESLNDRDSTSIMTRETVTAASPSRIRGGGGLFGRRRDSAYVDTVGVGFFNKLLAPVYPNPERAAALSFVLPGSGQVYNKRFAWLKVPIIYGLYGALIYNGENQRGLRDEYDEAYRLSLQGMPHQFSNTRFNNPRSLRTARDEYDKSFQLSYIGLVVLHLVQTLEAYTTSHLLNFDMDESLTVAPVMLVPPGSGAPGAVGVSAHWTFGR